MGERSLIFENAAIPGNPDCPPRKFQNRVPVIMQDL